MKKIILMPLCLTLAIIPAIGLMKGSTHSPCRSIASTVSTGNSLVDEIMSEKDEKIELTGDKELKQKIENAKAQAYIKNATIASLSLASGMAIAVPGNQSGVKKPAEKKESDGQETIAELKKKNEELEKAVCQYRDELSGLEEVRAALLEAKEKIEKVTKLFAKTDEGSSSEEEKVEKKNNASIDRLADMLDKFQQQMAATNYFNQMSYNPYQSYLYQNNPFLLQTQQLVPTYERFSFMPMPWQNRPMMNNSPYQLFENSSNNYYKDASPQLFYQNLLNGMNSSMPTYQRGMVSDPGFTWTQTPGRVSG